jgi:4'-phosphopantetheinyl transferase
MGDDRAGPAVIWAVVADEAALAERLRPFEGLLGRDEHTAAQRYKRADDRVRFVLARALARVMLSRCAAVSPQEWRFRLTRHGRPELDMDGELAGLRFNVSHTQGLVACGVAVGRDIGVDAEHIARPISHDIAARFFAPVEVARLEALPPADRARAFFDYWTLKEAYIKARGLGLTLPLHQFWFELRPGARPTVTFTPELPDDAASWQFVQMSPTPWHRLAAAIRDGRRAQPVRIEVTSPEALLA